MDTVVTSLLSSDLFLIETPNYTGSISAQDINYISNQFPKIYSVIDSYSANARIVTSETLSVSSIAPFTAKTATLTGNFNTFILSSGLILSAYNTSFPFINLKDFDFSLANALNGDFDDDGNDYIDSNTRKVVIPVSILNMPSNDILLAWKVQKFY